MDKSTKKDNVLIHVATPLIVFALCVGIAMIAMIKPADKLKVYLNLAFMDTLKSNPEASGSGLVIRENDIITDYDGETSDTGEIIRPKFGELYALVSSSAFDLSVPVYWGSNSELFEHGACQSSGSKVVGDDGNSVISAHEDTFFAELYKLKEGDTVTVKTNYGRFEYIVRETILFDKKDAKYVSPSEDTRLTLYTCKKDLLGNSDKRIGVICAPLERCFYNIAEEGSSE